MIGFSMARTDCGVDRKSSRPSSLRSTWGWVRPPTWDAG